MSKNTINELFYAAVERNSDCLMTYKQTVKWISISSREFYRDVVGTARRLAEWGIAKGDRVAILSENRPEWAVAEYATASLGGVVVPIYPTLTAEQTAYLLKDSGAKIIFLSTADQLKKFLAIKDQTAVEKAVVMDYIGITEGIPMHRLMHGGPTSRDAEFDARALTVTPDDLATIIYTSGTTGQPKGVMLTHGNLMSNLVFSLGDFGLGQEDIGISFLPLSHITARHVDYAMLYHGVRLAYCPVIDKLPEALLEVRPTLFIGVPRVYEKVRDRVQAETVSGWKHKVYRWALKVGQQHEAEILAGRTPSAPAWKLADALMFSKIRKSLGGRVKGYVSGGAPLGVELARWFAWIGIRICEGYGLTETSPVIAVNTPKAHKLGTVGKVLPNVEVKIAEDGEILVKGPSVFKAYWNLPEETRNAFQDGWFKTGDVGTLDSEGFLSVTDRKKDLIKTSGGKFVAPQPIESKLRNCDLVADAMVIGDKHKFPSVVIVPEFAVLETWAGDHGVTYASRQELVANPKVRELYESVVEEVNRDLAQFEKLKKMLLTSAPFSAIEGAVTPTMKLRRKAIEDRYHEEIEKLYAEGRSQESGVRSPQDALK